MSRLWSVSALADELYIDRRTLAKRLEGLAPVETRKAGERTERRYRLNDVVQHLARHDRATASNGHAASSGPPPNGFRVFVDAGVQHFAYWLTEHWAQTWTGLLKAEAGIEDAELRQRLFTAQYALLVHYLTEYLTGDVFADAHEDQTGWSLDALASRAAGQAVHSRAPTRAELAIAVPEVVRQWMTPEQRAALEVEDGEGG